MRNGGTNLKLKNKRERVLFEIILCDKNIIISSLPKLIASGLTWTSTSGTKEEEFQKLN